ncbi:adenine phosphoribosyltransferase-like [Protopterus annectens]|uniref:adenine phosphoribosyltransferase-like n=1 Tax=Protopterus annectens TaxID=7888 RepID=UPI001CFA6C0D|nr:adenine phosphoribosyltransferase-like [Protopterus annectens]
MDVWKVPETRQQGWYLALMAPNVKGEQYTWLDPSRLYCNSQALQDCVNDLLKPFQNDDIDLVAGIDAMGFILGAAVAKQLEKGFLAIRKEGHLCIKTDVQDYTDYSGQRKALEVRKDVIKPGTRILLVDQWIETGGSMEAAIKLVERQGGIVIVWASPQQIAKNLAHMQQLSMFEVKWVGPQNCEECCGSATEKKRKAYFD